MLWDRQKLGGNMWIQKLSFPIFYTKLFLGVGYFQTSRKVEKYAIKDIYVHSHRPPQC